MIDAAIDLIKNQLDQYLKRTCDPDRVEDFVTISNIIDQNGNVADHVNNKIVMFLINIEKDTTPFRKPSLSSVNTGVTTKSNPPIYLNLYLMIAGYFSKYSEALKVISHSISYFQAQPVFDHNNSPGLDKSIDKLILDIENLNIQDLSNLWGMLSGKYLPSVLYKVRMVAFDTGDITGQIKNVNKPETSFNH